MAQEMTPRLKAAVIKFKETQDDDAFAIIYEESKKYVCTCIHGVANGNYDENDVMEELYNETMMKMYQKIPTNDSVDGYLVYAGKTAHHLALAYFKKNNKYVLSDSEEYEITEDVADDDNFIPENLIDTKEKRRLIKDIIDNELTPMQRVCIIDYYYNEMKQSEIAEELDIPENTVKTNLSRAKAKIKEAVLKLEKEKGTKLYSIAPFMLLLFKDELEAFILPEVVAKSSASVVLTSATVAKASASAKVGSGATKVAGKAIGKTIKNKIIAGVAGVAVTGGVIGGVVYHNANSTITWQQAYSDYLLGTDEVDRFYLKDLDEDGKPEMMASNENGDFYLFRPAENGFQSVVTWTQEELRQSRTLYNDIRGMYGFGEEQNELIHIDYGTIELDGQSYELPEAWVHYYNTDGEQTVNTPKSYVVYQPNEDAPLTYDNCYYAVTDNGNYSSFDLNEGPVRVKEDFESKFHEVPYVMTSEESVKENIAKWE